MLEQHLEIARLTRELASQLLEKAVLVARHFDLGTTEVRAIEQLYLSGPMTAGDLGRALALTSGSVTALVKRLQANDLVERTVDRQDRRKVWISLRGDKIEELLQPYLSTIAQGQSVIDRFSDGDLATVTRFLKEYCAASSAESLATERDGDRSAKPGGRRDASGKITGVGAGLG
ncbi:MarR family transcriptional regulator [Altererythrobacter sp. FM1]|uniref:MarR family winged helix-turn-helix transcriptional regulator n=1 Tax=Tsuneonella flava TaxID=2055955 RepID=UPI000C810855|nr:MarR family transcriptional regulator [Tsuneonella flava]ROT93724.1 MarR family transcriptional regulator [Altererythrobacter sp. FM1]